MLIAYDTRTSLIVLNGMNNEHKGFMLLLLLLCYVGDSCLCVSRLPLVPTADLGGLYKQPEPGAPESGLEIPSCPTARRLRKAGFGKE